MSGCRPVQLKLAVDDLASSVAFSAANLLRRQKLQVPRPVLWLGLAEGEALGGDRSGRPVDTIAESGHGVRS